MAIVRHHNGTLYRYLGGNIFQNLITGAKGVVEDELARKIFRINLEATQIFEEYPKAEELVKRLKLKMIKGEEDVSGNQRQENGQA